jgi:hypothetical protein
MLVSSWSSWSGESPKLSERLGALSEELHLLELNFFLKTTFSWS